MSLSLLETIMPGERIGQERIFLAGAATDIVDHEGNPGGGLAIADDHDVRKIARQEAGDEIAGQVTGKIIGGMRQTIGAAGEEFLEVRDAAVVDVFIGTGKTPDFRVEGEVFLHILMDGLLEIEGKSVAEGTDDDIRTDAALAGYVAAGISKDDVSRIIDESDADLATGGLDHIERPGGNLSGSNGTAGQKSEEESAHSKWPSPTAPPQQGPT